MQVMGSTIPPRLGDQGQEKQDDDRPDMHRNRPYE